MPYKSQNNWDANKFATDARNWQNNNYAAPTVTGGGNASQLYDPGVGYGRNQGYQQNQGYQRNPWMTQTTGGVGTNQGVMTGNNTFQDFQNFGQSANNYWQGQGDAWNAAGQGIGQAMWQLPANLIAGGLGAINNGLQPLVDYYTELDAKNDPNQNYLNESSETKLNNLLAQYGAGPSTADSRLDRFQEGEGLSTAQLMGFLTRGDTRMANFNPNTNRDLSSTQTTQIGGYNGFNGLMGLQGMKPTDVLGNYNYDTTAVDGITHQLDPYGAYGQFGSQSPYGQDEAGIRAGFGGLQNLTGDTQMDNILRMRGAIQTQDQGAASPLQGAVEEGLMSGATGGLSPASQRVYGAREAQMGLQEQEQLRDMREGIGGDYSLWGSQRLESEQKAAQNMAANRQTLMADLMKQDSDNALNYIMNKQGLQQQALDTAAGVAGQADQSRIASNQAMAGYISDASKNMLGQFNTKLTEQQQVLDEQRANSDRQMQFLDMQLQEAQTNQQNRLQAGKMELDQAIANKTAELRQMGMGLEEATANANRDTQIQQLQLQQDQANKAMEAEILAMRNQSDQYRGQMEMDSRDSYNSFMNTMNAEIDTMFDNIFPGGMLPAGPMGGIGGENAAAAQGWGNLFTNTIDAFTPDINVSSIWG